jgi:XTP/dITP diphosphohydrolase
MFSNMFGQLYIASTNPGKLRDFAVAAESHGLTILPLPGLDTVAPPSEDEDTFAGNAGKKAAFYSRLLPGEIVLADDSGLEVDVLNGAPGVRSARYAADAGFLANAELTADARNNLFLLEQLSGIPEEDRGARYRCVLKAALDSQVLLTGEGSVAGRILTAPRGTGGFGYDPLFYLPEIGQTMAEIDLQKKDQLSHRGKALRALLTQLK